MVSIDLLSNIYYENIVKTNPIISQFFQPRIASAFLIVSLLTKGILVLPSKIKKKFVFKNLTVPSDLI